MGTVRATAPSRTAARRSPSSTRRRRRPAPTSIYAHAPHDTHQDHVATSLAALAAGRRTGAVLFYQSPSTTSFDPTVFVDVARRSATSSTSLQAHWSQVMQCAMVDLEAVEAGARYWGTRAKICYAEAFETPRFVWEIGRPRPPGTCRRRSKSRCGTVVAPWTGRARGHSGR